MSAIFFQLPPYLILIPSIPILCSNRTVFCNRTFLEQLERMSIQLQYNITNIFLVFKSCSFFILSHYNCCVKGRGHIYCQSKGHGFQKQFLGAPPPNFFPFVKTNKNLYICILIAIYFDLYIVFFFAFLKHFSL